MDSLVDQAGAELADAYTCLAVLGTLGAEAVDTLAEVMAQNSSDIAGIAARALGATGAAAAEPPLLTALASDNLPLQLAAAEALGRVGSVAAVQPLQNVVDIFSPRVLRRAVRQAIDKIQSRLSGAAPGQLSLAATETGQLSLAADTAGQLTLPKEEPTSADLGASRDSSDFQHPGQNLPRQDRIRRDGTEQCETGQNFPRQDVISRNRT